MTDIDTNALRELQRPLKEKYRSDPETALVTVHAKAGFESGDEGVLTCTVQGWAGPVRAGLNPATGGDGEDACSGDMLLEALLACAGVTLRSVATAMQLGVRSARLVADATFDARGTLGVSREAPVGCTGYRVVAEVDSDADDAALAKLGELTERYCVVGQSLRQPATFEVRRSGAT